MKARAWLLVGVGALVGLSSSSAQAEYREAAVGLEGGLALPGLASQDQTAFGLVTWSAGGFGRFGVTADLDLELRFDVSLFRAKVSETRTLQGRPLVGDRYFRAAQYHTAIGARYKLISGYFFAPYLEAQAGLLWLVLGEQQFLSPTGESYGLEVPDEGRGAFTATVGLAVDYRLFDLGTVGVAVRWVELFGGGVHQRYLSVPLQAAFYW